MANQYKAVLWNKQKKRYDRIMAIWIIAFLILYAGMSILLHPQITAETLIIRAFGLVAILLLHIILVIGPLSRINPKFLVLLYNRRHLGVTMFLMALIHGLFSIIQFHGFGNTNPIVSVFTSNTEYSSFLDFPFQTLGFVALIILLLMAATSHDFWLKNLSPGTWKTLHMLVYLAYALIVMHVMLGAVQNEKSFALPGFIFVGVLVISSLHIYSAKLDSRNQRVSDDWVAAGAVDKVPEDGAVTVFLRDAKVAIFNHGGKLSAVSNYCRHQGGPVGEGKIVDGCITCPWHGYQYYPHNGCSPPPFDEKLETYQLKIDEGIVFVNSVPNIPGTAVDPLPIDKTKSNEA